jgi:hypothetical protein
MISKHVQEILQIFSSAKGVTGLLLERGKKPLKISIVSSQYSPIVDTDIVFELSNGKTILSQDLEFATIKSTPQDLMTIELGNYQFFCN